MPVTLLTAAADTTARTIYTTGAVAPVAGRPLLLTTVSRVAGIPLNPGIAGLGATWSYIDIVIMNAGGTAGKLVLGLGLTPSGAPGTVTINWGVNQDGCIWSLSQCPATIDPATPVVQFLQAAGGTAAYAVTLAAFGNALNESYLCAAIKANTTSTPKAGWTELSDTPMTVPNTTLAANTLPSADPLTSGLWAAAAEWGAVAIELRTLIPSTGSANRLLRFAEDPR